MTDIERWRVFLTRAAARSFHQNTHTRGCRCSGTLRVAACFFTPGSYRVDLVCALANHLMKEPKRVVVIAPSDKAARAIVNDVKEALPEGRVIVHSNNQLCVRTDNSSSRLVAQEVSGGIKLSCDSIVIMDCHLEHMQDFCKGNAPKMVERLPCLIVGIDKELDKPRRRLLQDDAQCDFLFSLF